MKLILTITSIISLIIGTAIYLLFRSSTLKIFSWLLLFNIDFINSGLRNWALLNSNIFPKWFIFSLPDGLWIFSYVCIMLCIWNLEINNKNIIWIIFIPLIAITSEICQKMNIISGTFDPYDLLLYTIGFITPILISIKTINFKKL